MIILSFETQQLHDTCVALASAEQAFGSMTAAALVTFISEASAFANVAELIDFHGDGMRVSGDDSVSVAIGADYNATLQAVGSKFARDAGGRVEWESVTRLKLIAISRVL